MKVLFLTLNTHGGMNHYISQLVNAISKKEDVVVIAPVGLERDNFRKDIRIIELELGTVIRKVILNTIIFTRPIKIFKNYL